MIGIAMGIALLPSLSRRLRAGDALGARTSLNRAVEIAAFLTIPAAFALAIIPEFLITGLYQRGAFTAETTAQVTKALRMFAYGVPAFVMLKVMTPAFFAREDTKTPMIYAGLSAIINIALGLYMFKTIGFHGLALATSVAAGSTLYVSHGCSCEMEVLTPTLDSSHAYPALPLPVRPWELHCLASPNLWKDISPAILQWIFLCWVFCAALGSLFMPQPLRSCVPLT